VAWNKKTEKETHLPSGGVSVSSVDAVVAVVGRLRDSWRRFETPASLLKDALDFPNFWLLEKLCFIEFDRNISIRALANPGWKWWVMNFVLAPQPQRISGRAACRI